MALSHEESERQVREWSANVEKWDVSALLGIGLGASLDLAPLRRETVACMSIAKGLLECDLSTVPARHLETSVNALKSVYGQFQRMEAYRTSGNLGDPNRSTVIGSMPPLHAELYAAAATVIGFARMQGPNIGESVRRANEQLAEIRVARDHAANVRLALDEFNVSRVVAKQSQRFVDLETDYRRAALGWLIALGGLMLIVLGLLVYEIRSPLPEDLKTAQVVAHFAPRAVLASVFFFALSLLARNYRAAKHNMITNQHRAAALTTHDVFAATAPDQAVKTAILTQVAATAFAHQPTGFGNDQPDPVPHALAVDLLQKAVSK